MAAEWHRDTGYIPIVEESLETDIVTDLVDENPNYGVALAQLEHAKTADLTNWLRENINEIKTRFSTVYGDNAERSEEHTSELQSRGQLVCRLLLEKKTNLFNNRADTGSIMT